MPELDELDKQLNCLNEKQSYLEAEIEKILQTYKVILDRYDQYREMKKNIIAIQKKG